MGRPEVAKHSNQAGFQNATFDYSLGQGLRHSVAAFHLLPVSDCDSGIDNKEY